MTDNNKTYNSGENTPVGNDKAVNAAIENILTRTSVRRYQTDDRVSKKDLDTILHAAMAAPTGVNKRPWHFVAVTDRGLLKKLASTLPYCHMAAEAPLAIVVCVDRNRFLDGDDATLWVQDLGAASENILLAANALGLGGVWTAVYPHADRMQAVSDDLSLADNLVPFNVIPIGHPLVPPHARDKWEPDRVTYL